MHTSEDAEEGKVVGDDVAVRFYSPADAPFHFLKQKKEPRTKPSEVKQPRVIKITFYCVKWLSSPQAAVLCLLGQ